LALGAWLLFAAAWGALHWLIVPRIGELRPNLEAMASELIGLPVRVEAIEAHTAGLTPSFALRNVRLLDRQGGEALKLALEFEPLHIEGPTVALRRAADGRIRIAGIESSGDPGISCRWKRGRPPNQACRAGCWRDNGAEARKHSGYTQREQPMKVAAIQMVSASRLQPNLEHARVLLEQAAAGGAEVAALPEYFCLLGHRDTDKLAIQERFGDGPIQSFLAQAARELGLWIVGGTLPLSGEWGPHEHEHEAGAATTQSDPVGSGRRRVFNSALVFSPAGECVARYDKMHLFRFDNGRERYDESRALVPGSAPASFELRARDGERWKVGLSVCYDLRFPEIYRRYAAEGVELLLVPSAFTHTTGQAHWEVLLRARAIENLAYVLAPAQGGLHENGRRTWGHSLQVDPWGTVLSRRVEGQGVDIVDMDMGRLRELRQQLPALAHRVL